MPTGAKEQLRVEIRLRDFMTSQLKRIAGGIRRFATVASAKFKAIGRAVFSLKGMLVGLGAGLLAKSFIQAGSSMEKFRVQLNAVLDQNKLLAAQTLKWVRDFAAATPFTTKAVIESFVTMKAAGIDATKAMMSTIGDVAFVFDKDINELSVALIGLEKEVFQKLGVQWEIVGKKAKITLGNLVIETDKSKDAMRKGILDLWAKKFPGAMKEAETKWDGMLSLMKSQIYEFQADVMESGPFDFLKAAINVVIGQMGGLADAAPKVGEAFVSAMGIAVVAVGKVASAINTAYIATLEISKALAKIKISKEGQDAIGDFFFGVAEGSAAGQAAVSQMINEFQKAEGELGDVLEIYKDVWTSDLAKIYAKEIENGTIKLIERKTVLSTTAILQAEIDHAKKKTFATDAKAFQKAIADQIAIQQGLRAQGAAINKLSADWVVLRKAWADAERTGTMEEREKIIKQILAVEKKLRSFQEAGKTALKQAGAEYSASVDKAEALAKAAKRAAASTKEMEKHTSNVAKNLVKAAAEAVKNAAAMAEAANAFKDATDEARLAESKKGLDEWRESLMQVRDAAASVGNVLVNNIMASLDDALEGTFRWKKALQDVAQDLGKMLMRQALMAAVQFGANALASAAGGGGFSRGEGINQQPAGYGRGGVVLGGIGLPSAQTGTVVRGPTPLVAGDDRSGVGEGILPLRKTRGGELGVQATGGQAAPMQVTFNINTIDAKGTDEFLHANRGKLGDMMGVNQTEGHRSRSSF